MTIIKHLIVTTGTLILTASLSAQAATTFTYQCELLQNGSPTTGSFDLQFQLWDAVSGGAQIGNTQVNNNVPVVEGRRTVEIDFGADAFAGDDRWLEVIVEGTALAMPSIVFSSIGWPHLGANREGVGNRCIPKRRRNEAMSRSNGTWTGAIPWTGF